mmetsp:Transcript_29806/g.83990  ORF Transcript_29806/g.83990 Transcript_29806/m.83990 type:complete len:484 (-) Transcript_29806:31-1482(-)
MEKAVCVGGQATGPRAPPPLHCPPSLPIRSPHGAPQCRLAKHAVRRGSRPGTCGRRRLQILAGSSAGRGSDGSKDELNGEWASSAIPSYLYEASQCGTFHSWLAEAASIRGDGKPMNSEEFREMMRRNPVWLAIRAEAERDAKEEPILSSFLWASVLSHDSFERSLAFVLANRLADATMMPTELFDVFYSVLKSSPATISAALADCQAAMERDPACTGYAQALLYYKGFHSLQAQRIAHVLWNKGRKVLALALQSRVSEVLSVDIHPATRLGTGILLDHGTGIVIGETAVVGNNCSMLQGVTLGGTGKSTGDRHPKVGSGVLIGANATVLGNISVGNGAQIAAGSLVLKPVPEWGIVAGSPAKLVGQVAGRPPALEMKQWIKETDQDPYDTTPSMELTSADLQSRSSSSKQNSVASADRVAAPKEGKGMAAAKQEWGSNVNGHAVKVCRKGLEREDQGPSHGKVNRGQGKVTDRAGGNWESRA